MAYRQAGVRKSVQRLELDALILTNPINLRYLFGFSGSTGVAVLTGARAILLVDARYTEQAAQETTACEVLEAERQSWGAEFRSVVKDFSRLGFEAGHLTYHQTSALQSAVGNDTVCVPTSGLVEEHREVKDAVEIGLIRNALDASRAAFAELMGDFPWGVSENEAAARLDLLGRLKGSSGPSFDTIVLTGARTSLPHGRPGEARINPDEVLLIDFGIRLAGYCSDLTRTRIPAGHPASVIAEVVTNAQAAAIAAVRPGTDVRAVDAAARNVITAAGYGSHFGHGTGHGIGLEIHEGPRISPQGTGVLRPGMVFTIEPGIYLPGQAGVRIEDVVVVTESGCEVLSR